MSVIKTPYIERIGTKAGPLARLLLKHSRTKHYMRMFYSLQSAWKLKEAQQRGSAYQEYFQAGKSVQGIQAIEAAGEIVQRYAKAARSALG